MPNEIIEVYLAPSGGLNQSDSSTNASPDNAGHSLFESGDYRYAANIHIGRSKSVNEGGAENFQSTLLVDSYLVWNGSAWVTGSPQAGTNTSLGKYEDHTAGRVYWAVKNSNGHDAILMFVKDERQIYELLQWDGLNFSGNFVSMSKISKFLILTDGNPDDATGMPPRMIDVTTIFELYATLNVNFSEYHISFVKWAPVDPPSIDGDGFTPEGNVFIKKGIRQFAYRLIYIGGFRSCWSPPSYFVTNEQYVTVNVGNPSPNTGFAWNFKVQTPGFVFDYNDPASTAFDYTSPKFYEIVESIEFGYRESETATWKVFERVAIDGAAYGGETIFYDNGPAFQVADADIGQYYDAVPLLSRATEAIDNRPMFGNNLDDLPPMEDFDVTNIEVYSVQMTEDNWYEDPAFPSLLHALVFRRMSFKENGVYKLGIIFKNYSGRSGLVQTLDKWSYSIPVNNDANPQSIEDIHALGFKIPDGLLPPDWAVDYQIVRSNCLNIDMFILGIVNDIRLLKINANDTSAATDNAALMNTTIRDTLSGYFDSTETGGSQYSAIARIIAAVRRNLQASVTTATLIYFDITNWSLDVDLGAGTPAPVANSIFYNWIAGDRIRFWTNSLADMSGTWTQHDEQILEYGGTSLVIPRPANMGYTKQRRDGVPVPPNKAYTIEVYRPKKNTAQSAVIFYEMGEWYPIVEPGTANRDFSKKDFTWTNSASVTTSVVAGRTIYNKFPIINGDVWSVTKNFFRGVGFFNPPGYTLHGYGYMLPFVSGGTLSFSTINDYAVWPQMNPDRTNVAGIWEHNNGRPLVAYRYLPKQFNKSTQIRFGGKFLEDSLFIGINNFQEGNQFIYPSEYGPIRAMANVSNVIVKTVGNILLVMCEEETMSVYINRTSLEDLSGHSQVSLSDKVLGSFNTLLGSYGTLNPESVSKRNSRVIYWSQKQGTWVRYSDDGLTPISDRKMYNWFNDLSLLMAPSFATETPARAITVFDNYYEEWVTRFDHADLPDTFRGYPIYKCVSFSEDDKRWKQFYDFAAEFFAMLENEVYSIVGTTLYIHYQGADYGSFYGVKKDSYFQPVANSQFRKTKIWQAVAVESTDKWSFPAIDGDYKSNGANIQTTTLSLDNMTDLEGVFWSDIKRDTNTPNRSGDDALNNGNVMRSKALTLLMKLDPAVTWYSILNWVMASYQASEKTFKK